MRTSPAVALPLLATLAHADVPAFVSLDRTSLIRFSHDGVSKTGLGATRLGGYGRYATRDLEVVGRASLILPTASFIPRGSYFEHVAVHGTLFPFLEERAIDADAFWVQLGTSLRYRRGAVVMQVDGLVDVPISGSVGAADASRGAPARIHGGAAPYQVRPWRLGAELLVSGYPTREQLSGDLEPDELTFYGATVSATRVLAPNREVMLWFGNPLNQYLRSRWHAAGIGYQHRL